MADSKKINAVDANGEELEFEVEATEESGIKMKVKDGFILKFFNKVGSTVYYFFEEKNYSKK